MIDLSTGIIEFNNIVIKPDSEIEDYFNLSSDILEFVEIEPKFVSLLFKNPIENNGIKANIVFYIDENENSRFVTISPFNFDPNLETLEASKIWLEGITEGGKYKTTESSIIVDYNWGYLIAQYYPDRDYGIIGGDIHIRYNE